MFVFTTAFRKAVHRPRRVPSFASPVRALGTHPALGPGHLAYQLLDANRTRPLVRSLSGSAGRRLGERTSRDVTPRPGRAGGTSRSRTPRRDRGTARGR